MYSLFFNIGRYTNGKLYILDGELNLYGISNEILLSQRDC